MNSLCVACLSELETQVYITQIIAYQIGIPVSKWSLLRIVPQKVLMSKCRSCEVSLIKIKMQSMMFRVFGALIKPPGALGV